MLEDKYQRATDNKPDVILTLVADCTRASEVWEHLFNESRYLPYAPQATNGDLCELELSPDDDLFRETTPPSEGPGVEPKKEPGLQLRFSNPPKNPALGYLLGSDEEVCDVYLGSTKDTISACMLSISFNEHNELILRSSDSPKINPTRVTYSIDGTQQVTRTHFSWILLPEVQTLHVNVAKHIEFWVVMPKHVTDQAAYQANCRKFRRLAHGVPRTLSLPNGWSLPSATPASGAATPQARAEPPFYLRTAVIGDGGFGVVYKARSMPDGRTVAVKTFKSKNAWTLEASVLRKISKTPHENIVEFIDFGLGDIPHLVMGLASGGNLEQQHKLRPFTVQEIALILRQMLNALCYLHITFSMSHRDVKPQNILCDDRLHYRLADFGLAKKGNALKTFNGTKPYMAPEMFSNTQYTTAVDIYALGMVVARYLSRGRPGGYSGEEGLRWCAAVVAHFEKYTERSEAAEVKDPERTRLNILVGQHMLRIKPEERKSAPGCIELLDRYSDNDSNTGPQGHQNETFPNRLLLNDAKERSKNIGLTEKHEPLEENELGSEGEGVPEGEDHEYFEDQDPTEDVDTEAVTDIRSLTTEEWLSLEREHAVNENERSLVPQHFIDGSFIDDPDNMPEHSATLPDSDGQSGPEPSQGKQDASPAAPSGVLNKSQKRKRSSE